MVRKNVDSLKLSKVLHASCFSLTRIWRRRIPQAQRRLFQTQISQEICSRLPPWKQRKKQKKPRHPSENHEKFTRSWWSRDFYPHIAKFPSKHIKMNVQISGLEQAFSPKNFLSKIIGI